MFTVPVGAALVLQVSAVLEESAALSRVVEPPNRVPEQVISVTAARNTPERILANETFILNHPLLQICNGSSPLFSESYELAVRRIG
jgi:hypothetical protein